MNPFRKRREERLRREKERREARRAALSARLRGETPPEVEADLAAAEEAPAKVEQKAEKAPAPAKPRVERPARAERGERRRRPGAKAEEDRPAPAERGERRRRPARKRERARRGPITTVRGRIALAAGTAARAFGNGLVATRRRLLGARPGARRAGSRAGAALRPLAAGIFRAAAVAERLIRGALRTGSRAVGAVVGRLDRLITPERAVFGVAIAAAACLVVSQFTDYRGVQVGQPGYAEVAAIAPPPEVDVQTTGQAHSYLLIPVAGFAALAAAASLSPKRRRLGLFVALAGLAGVAVSLLVDMPKGLDEGTAAIRFSGAHATLKDGFYGQLAACGALVFCGLLLGLRPGPARGRARARRPKRRRRPRRRPSLARSGT